MTALNFENGLENSPHIFGKRLEGWRLIQRIWRHGSVPAFPVTVTQHGMRVHSCILRSDRKFNETRKYSLSVTRLLTIALESIKLTFCTERNFLTVFFFLIFEKLMYSLEGDCDCIFLLAKVDFISCKKEI